MKDQPNQHKPIIGSVGLFISPEGVLFRAEGGSHISKVIGSPSKFGLTVEQIKHLYDFFGEKLGVEGLARKQILTYLVEMGWIRLRRYPNKQWSVNVNRLTRKTTDLLEDWANKFIAGFAGFRESDPYMPVSIMGCSGNVIRRPIKEIADGALSSVGRRSAQVKRIKIRFLESAALLSDVPPLYGSDKALKLPMSLAIHLER
jgi:hypothetical protein